MTGDWPVWCPGDLRLVTGDWCSRAPVTGARRSTNARVSAPLVRARRGLRVRPRDKGRRSEPEDAQRQSPGAGGARRRRRTRGGAHARASGHSLPPLQRGQWPCPPLRCLTARVFIIYTPTHLVIVVPFVRKENSLGKADSAPFPHTHVFADIKPRRNAVMFAIPA